MDRRPLPEDVARTARAFLAALVPADELSDAWHELLDDVAYWGDRHLVGVLRLARQVALQHERVAPEVALLALLDVGLDDIEAAAAVLDLDADGVSAMRADVERSTAAGGSGRFAASPPPVQPTAPVSSTAGPESAFDDPAGGTAPEVTPRLRFDDHNDHLPVSVLDGQSDSASGAKRLLVVGALIWVVVVVLWLVTGR